MPAVVICARATVVNDSTHTIVNGRALRVDDSSTFAYALEVVVPKMEDRIRFSRVRQTEHLIYHKGKYTGGRTA